MDNKLWGDLCHGTRSAATAWLVPSWARNRASSGSRTAALVQQGHDHGITRNDAEESLPIWQKKKKRPYGSNFSGVFRWQVVTSSPVFSSWKSCLYTQEITYGLIQSSPEMPLLDSNPKGHKPPMSSFAVSQGISKQIACGLTSLVAEANVPFRSPLTKKRDSVTHFRNQRVQFET